MMGLSKQIMKTGWGVLAAFALLLLFAAPTHAAPRWSASYWNNTSLSGPPALQRLELSNPNYNWGAGSPMPGVIQSDYFSARWNTSQYFDPGRYRFSVKSDDGSRLWVGGQPIIDQWHDATNVTYTAEYDVTTAGSLPIILEYYENRGNAMIHLSWERIGGVASTGPTKAEYFNNMYLEGEPALLRYENEIHHRWGLGSPAPGIINSDHFSARYTRTMDLEAGRYRFTAQADDGIRMWINGQLLIDQWYDSPAAPMTVELDLYDGIAHFIVAYYENVGNAEISVSGAKIGENGGGSGGGTSPPATTVTATVDTSYLNLRSGPGTQYAPIDVLRRGTVVELTGSQVDYWVEVITPSGQVGWVSNSYLDYNAPFSVG